MTVEAQETVQQRYKEALDAFVEKAGRRVHCATGTQTLMALVGRAGVKD